jgi:putative proteasome-type protease
MTYCVAMNLQEGLLFASDSRTSGGVDQVATFSKMTVFESPGDRVIVLLNSGNLSTTQTVVSLLRQAVGGPADNLMSVGSLFDVASLVGEQVRSVIASQASRPGGPMGVDFSCNFLVGGQIAGERPRLFLVYAEGNFIEATDDTPFFQIGESKYGKPIIDRVVRPDTPLSEAVKCALVSFDSTMRSNLSVGLPLDVALVRREQLSVSFRYRIDHQDLYFGSLREGWSQGLRGVFNALPAPDWLKID